MKTPINDGGPAFPRPASEYEPNEMRADGRIAAVPYSGMSLRDYFAGQALAGYLADTRCPDRATPDVVARWCYSNADAMIAERAKGQQ